MARVFSGISEGMEMTKLLFFQNNSWFSRRGSPGGGGRGRVHRIPPRVRDDREPPLLSRRDGANFKSDLGESRMELFLPVALDTTLARDE